MKLLLALLFLLIAAPIAHAQSQLPPNIFDSAAGSNPANPPLVDDNCPAYSGFTLNPCMVDEATFVVEVRIEDVPPLTEGQYYYCLKTDPNDCDEDDLKSVGGLYNDSLGVVTFPKLCGDGDKKLKTDCDTDGSDWFHSGKIYRVSLFDDDEEGAYTGREAAFYIMHYYPEVDKPQAGGYPSLNVKAVRSDPKGYSLKVELKGRNPRGKNDDKYNDYFLRVDGYDNDYKSQDACLFVGTGGTGTATVRMPKQYTDNEGNVKAELTEGTYLLKIFDGKDGNFSETNATCKENNFIYYYVPFTIGQGDRPGVIFPAIKDPKGKELSVARVRPVPAPICPEEDKNDYGYCTKIPTALGIKINTEPHLFIRDIFTIVLSVGGIAATFIFIQAGYTLMTSAGNKEKVAAAREQITSAIMGLIFIILSITILEFIGINILRLPGFGN